jgi:hypothetical protein
LTLKRSEQRALVVFIVIVLALVLLYACGTPTPVSDVS